MTQKQSKLEKLENIIANARETMTSALWDLNREHFNNPEGRGRNLVRMRDDGRVSFCWDDATMRAGDPKHTGENEIVHMEFCNQNTDRKDIITLIHKEWEGRDTKGKTEEELFCEWLELEWEAFDASKKTEAILESDAFERRALEVLHSAEDETINGIANEDDALLARGMLGRGEEEDSAGKTYVISIDGQSATIQADNLQAAREAVEESIKEKRGDYGCENSTVSVDYSLAGEDGEELRGTFTLDPVEPDCSNEDGHDWRRPKWGLGENPGVTGHDGGVVIHEVCSRCRVRKVEDTWAQRQDTGEQGLHSLTYLPAEEPDEQDVEQD
jgi:hypothetical protein